MSLGCVALFFAAAGSRVCFCWRHGRTCLAGSLSDKHTQKRAPLNTPRQSLEVINLVLVKPLQIASITDIRPAEHWNQWTSTHIKHNLCDFRSCWVVWIWLYDVLCDLLLFLPHSTAFLWPSPRHSSRGMSSVRRDGVSGQPRVTRVRGLIGAATIYNHWKRTAGGLENDPSFHKIWRCLEVVVHVL